MENQFKKPFLQIVVVFVYLICTNCEQTIDLPILATKPRIVIFGVLESDSMPKIFVSESKPYYTYVDNEFDYALIENAQVEISDGKQTWKLQPDSIQYLPPDSIYIPLPIYNNLNKKPYYAYAFTTNMRLKAGQKYEVSVRKNGITAKAEGTVLPPLKVEFTERFYRPNIYSPNKIRLIDYEISNKPYGQYFRTLLAKNTIKYVCEVNRDTGGLVKLDSFALYRYKAGSRYQFDEDELHHNYISIDHSCLSSDHCSNTFYTNQPDSIQVQLAIQLIDSNLVNYITQLNYQQEVEYNPFLEPAPVDDLVENGLGILTSVASSEWKTFWVTCTY